MKKNELTTPVYAIGGIGLDDIPALMETGIHGIAVSGLITQSEDKNNQTT
jgi:thiamine-phosphate pyrophosphorylase